MNVRKKQINAAFRVAQSIHDLLFLLGKNNEYYEDWNDAATCAYELYVELQQAERLLDDDDDDEEDDQ